MKPADGHLHAAREKRLRQIERVRKLIRLHADEHHHARAGLLDHAREAFRTDARVRLVKGMDLDLDVITEDMALGAIAGQAIKRRERVGRNGGAQPLDHVAVIVVVRRLDENEAKALCRERRCSGVQHHGFRSAHHTQHRPARQQFSLCVLAIAPRDRELFRQREGMFWRGAKTSTRGRVRSPTLPPHARAHAAAGAPARQTRAPMACETSPYPHRRSPESSRGPCIRASSGPS